MGARLAVTRVDGAEVFHIADDMETDLRNAEGFAQALRGISSSDAIDKAQGLAIATVASALLDAIAEAEAKRERIFHATAPDAEAGAS